MPAQMPRIGRYEILGEIGRGGMGAVYRARDPVLDRLVALKQLSAELLAEPGMRDRFLREARSAARLQHPNIVTVYEFGEVEGTPFIAMELLEGENLADALEHQRLKDLGSRLGVVVQLCDALAYAHRHGVIHRDVKPTNVTILPNGTVKIVDFGIAFLEGGTMATRTGMLLGTPAYMAPEQFAGGVVDARVDMWSVGIILYEMIAGRRPFEGETVLALIYQIVHNPPPPLETVAPGTPPRLAAIVQRALAKNPLERFPDLEVMGRELRALEDALPTLVGPPPRPSNAARVAPPLSPPGQLDTVGEPPPWKRSASPLPAPAPRIVAHTPIALQTPFLEAGSFGEARRVQVIAISPDETLLAAGGTDGSIRLWDLESRAKVATLRNREHLRTGHGSVTTALAFSEDGSLLASGHLDGAVYLWEVATGLELDVRPSHEGAIGGLAMPPGGTVLITAGSDATLKFWELPALQHGDLRRTLRRQPEAATCLCLGSGGRQVVTGHTNRTVRVHDTESFRLVATFHGHRAPVSAVASSDDGNLLAVGARDGALRVFDLASREEVGAHREHSRAVTSALFLPGACRVASVAMDSVVVVWDATEPEAPLLLQGSDDATFASLAFARTRSRLIAARADGYFQVWAVNP
jgi:serine/threonine protein kinase